MANKQQLQPKRLPKWPLASAPLSALHGHGKSAPMIKFNPMGL